MTHRKIQKHIEIVRSSIPALSSMSKKSCDAILNLLRQYYTQVGVTTVDNLEDLESLVLKQPDLVFMGMKYVPGGRAGSEIWISEYLDQHRINHTGSPKEAIELEQNKPLAKQRVQASGIKTAQYLVIENGGKFDAASTPLRFPLFIKPTGLGAGQGVDIHSVVHNVDQLHAKVASLAADFDSDALIETFLPGREYSVAILQDEDSKNLTVMPLELVAGPDLHGHRILSYELKSAPLETPVFPVTDKKVRTALIDLATDVFIALGARDYGRIDIRMDEAGVPHFLEANLIPCLIEGSGNFPKACAMNIGMSYSAMILHIVRLGLARSADDEADPINVYSPVTAPVPA